jgi:hypothetical protein
MPAFANTFPLGATENINMRLLGLIILFVTCSALLRAQSLKSDYLIGRWEHIDSTTGLKNYMTFSRNGRLEIHYDDTSTWRYSTKVKDSIIFLKYSIRSKKATLLHSGVLIVKNKDCFWLFNPVTYDKLLLFLEKGYDKSDKKSLSCGSQITDTYTTD